MSRKNIFQVGISVLTVLFFVVVASAQMSNMPSQANQTPPANNQNPSMSNPTANNTSPGTNQQASKSTAKMSRHKMSQSKEGAYTPMENLWKENQGLYDDWTKINEHYISMMKITDPSQLQKEMTRHQEMLNNYNQKFTAYQDMWRKDMAEMQPSATQGKNASATNMHHYKSTNYKSEQPTTQPSK